MRTLALAKNGKLNPYASQVQIPLTP